MVLGVNILDSIGQNVKIVHEDVFLITYNDFDFFSLSSLTLNYSDNIVHRKIRKT